MRYRISMLFWLVALTGISSQSETYSERKARQLAGPSPFQKEIDGEYPERIAYQDSLVVALNSFAPQAPVHLLIVPRKRIATINDLTDGDSAILAHMFMAARKLAAERGVAETGYRLAINTNEDAGQSAFHIHMHLLGGMKTGPMVDQRWRNEGPLPGRSYQRALDSIKSIYEAYFQGWLKSDSTALLAQMTPGATIMPAGLAPVSGRDMIRAYWFPSDGSRTTVTRFEHEIDEVRLDGNIAWIRGHSSLSFVYEKDGVRVEKSDVAHSRLMLFERQQDDRWLITCNMWGNLPDK
ncbi:MAG: HIT domain-containing protein [Saprospiraceae bacterium]